MRKIFSLILTFICTISFSINAFAKKTYEPVEVNVPPKILFLGDSIATGFGLEGYENGRQNCHSYANQLTDKYMNELKEKCETYSENLAIDGQTSSQLIDKIQSGTYDKQLENVDAVVISIGGNDILSVYSNLFHNNSEDGFFLTEIAKNIVNMGENVDKNVEAFDGNIAKIGQMLNEKSDAKIIVQTLYNPFNEDYKIPFLNDFFEKKITAINDSIFLHKNDENGGYLVADVYSQFIDKGSDYTKIDDFDVHPNQLGHDTIADCVDKAIKLEKYTYNKEIEVPDDDTAGFKNTFIQTTIFICAIIILSALIVFLVVYIGKRRRK